MDGVELRALHVLAAALLVGVPLATALAGGNGRASEWLFWPAAAVLVLGGIANLGALGEVPPIRTRWGLILAAKLVLLLAVLAVSAVRLRHSVQGRPAPRLWAATGVLSGTALVLAVVLAHG